MEEVSIIGVDIAKHVFQLHGARADGLMAYSKKLSRGKLLPFLASQPRCVVAMEACAGSHHWGRQIEGLGHQVRLIAPAYVKPFVKRQKNDAADAEAIAEAATRPTMRFVAVKSAEKQASGMVFRVRDLLVRQRTQTINALRGHLSEHGIIAPNGTYHVGRLSAEVESPHSSLPAAAIEMCKLLLLHIATFDEQIAGLDQQIRQRARQEASVRRLMSIPGIGPICATALEALAPPPETSKAATSQPGWASFPGNIPRRARHVSGESRRWGNGIFGAC
jgi:transposase